MKIERDPQSYEGRSLMWTGDAHAAPPRRSLSAEAVAMLRAAHQALDDPVIHSDPLALRIIGAEGRHWMETNPAAQQIPWVRATRKMLATRTRLSEEALLRAVGRGTTQYVVLGAGLDTSAYRLEDLAGRVTTFEVDEPSTQAWKLERLEDAGIAIPANLRFVPVDFNTGSLAEALACAGFDRAAPAFFSWLGVSYYLPLESILDTMRFISGHDAPSEVMLDIALAESAVRPEDVDHHRYFRGQMSKTAEPWLSWLEPRDFRGTLLGLGFTEVEVIEANEAVERFVSSYAYPSLMAFVSARKG
jgi:methyltransferase (TIGR00027 family)